ncbi:MAG: homoserine O-acetyltransferase family protein [Longimicrobiales bacterium]
MNPDTLRYHGAGDFELESGHVLHDVTQAYTLTGTLNAARDNLVVVLHSLTGDADPQSWWGDVIGPDRAIDTRQYAVLCANLLGSCYGTTRVPAGVRVTPRDMARLIAQLIEALGVESVALATGGSLGGMVTLEWAASFPRLTRAAVVFAAPAAHTAQAIGFSHIQRRAIEVGGAAGLEIARMAAMMTYRTATEFDARFGRDRRDDGRFQVQSYLEYQGAKFVHCFDAEAYCTLLDAMDEHDVGRERGGVGPALRAFEGELTGVGITGDLLYEPETVRSWTDAAGAHYREIDSLHGHDAFLLEPDQAGAILRDALAPRASISLVTG